MPLYEYQCEDCKTVIEVLEPCKEDVLYVEDTHDCPACSCKMRFIYSSIFFRLHGSGFYKTNEE